MIRRRFVVRGRVQGVGFRWFVQRTADQLGVAGFVQNQADGSVLCEAEGEAAALSQFAAALADGPPRARVDAIETTDLPARGARGFTAR